VEPLAETLVPFKLKVVGHGFLWGGRVSLQSALMQSTNSLPP
jgi:hypothetical protein